MKEACIEMLQRVVEEFQKVAKHFSAAVTSADHFQNRAAVTDEVMAHFQDVTRKIDPSPSPRMRT